MQKEAIDKHGVDVRLMLPHRAFERDIGTFAGLSVAPVAVITAVLWRRWSHDKI